MGEDHGASLSKKFNSEAIGNFFGHLLKHLAIHACWMVPLMVVPMAAAALPAGATMTLGDIGKGLLHMGGEGAAHVEATPEDALRAQEIADAKGLDQDAFSNLTLNH